MRLAFINELFLPHIGGIEKRFYELGRELLKRNHEVHVFTIRHDKKLPLRETMDGFVVHRFMDGFNYYRPNSRAPFPTMQFSMGLPFKLCSRDFDAYFVGQWPFFHIYPLSLVKSPLVMDWSEVWLDKFFSLQKILGKLVKSHSAVSKYTLNRLVNDVHVRKAKVTHIPNGIHVEKYRNQTKNHKPGKITYIGRLLPHKRLDLLVKAFIEMKKHMSNIELFIAGKGPLFPRLKQISKQIDDMHVLGWISEERKVKLLQSSWIFASLSEREGFNISVLESLAAGTPAVVADFPDNAAKEEFATGVVTVKPTLQKITSILVKMMRDQAFWDRRHHGACTEAKKYQWSKIGRKLENLFLYLM